MEMIEDDMTPPPYRLITYARVDRVLDSYHEVRKMQMSSNMACTVECVVCRNKKLDGSLNPLVTTDHTTASGPLSIGDIPSNELHLPLILPCGHIAGWSCLEKEPTGRCPSCSVVWRRQGDNQCRHPIGINPYRPYNSGMTAKESEWLVPSGGYVPDVCRRCATLEMLRQLTRLARATVPPERGRCVYATDGVVDGLLEDDDLIIFTRLEIVMKPPLVEEAVMREAGRLEEAVRLRYAGKTPKAESELVGAGRKGGFVFKLAGIPKPKTEDLKC